MKYIIYRIATDREGESKITLTMPRSELPEVLKLSLLLEQLIDANFRAAKEANP